MSYDPADLDILLGPPNQWPEFAGYRELNVATSEIRLLYVSFAEDDKGLCISTIHTSLNESTVEYEAVSYCWGPPGDTRTIEIDGQSVRIRASLYALLKTFCQIGQQWPIWVDALCINQLNVSERNRQVAMMGRIYHGASYTKIWLGEHDMYTDFAFAYIKYGSMEEVRGSGEWAKIQSRARDAIGQILGKSYWRRLWVIQEIGFSRNILVICGMKQVSFYELIQAIEALWPLDESEQNTTEKTFSSYIDLQDHRFEEIAMLNIARVSNHIQSLQQLRERMQTPGLSLSDRTESDSFHIGSALGSYIHSIDTPGGLLYWLKKFEKCQCEDTRDKIFGLRSIASDGDAITIDYSTSPLDLVMQIAFKFLPTPKTWNTDIYTWNEFTKFAALSLIGNMKNLALSIASSDLTDKSFGYRIAWRISPTKGNSRRTTVETRVNVGDGLAIDSWDCDSNQGPRKRPSTTSQSSRLDKYRRGVTAQLMEEKLWVPTPISFLSQLGEVDQCAINIKRSTRRGIYAYRSVHLSPAAVLLLALFGNSIPADWMEVLKPVFEQRRERHGFTHRCVCDTPDEQDRHAREVEKFVLMVEEDYDRECEDYQELCRELENVPLFR